MQTNDPFADYALGDDSTPEAEARHKRWQNIWLRAIALAWSNEQFKAALLADPRKAISRVFKYDLPETLDLKIYEVNSADAQWNARGNVDWATLPPTRLEMPLPPAPKIEDQAVAISDYADAGRTYPFTCY